MEGFNSEASLLPQGSGTIRAMSGGAITAPLGLATVALFEARRPILDQLSDTIKNGGDSKTFYETLKADEILSAVKMEILLKVAAAGLISSIRVEPENTISSTHFNELYSIKLLFDNLKERSLTMEDISIRFTDSDELEIVIHSTAAAAAAAPPVAAAVAAPAEPVKSKKQVQIKD